MSNDEAARVALRRLARGTDAAHGPGETATGRANRLSAREGRSSSIADSFPETPSAESGADKDRRADSPGPTSADVVGRAVAAVDDLDEAARFAGDGGVEALAGALTGSYRPPEDTPADEGTDALRAFCAFERAAARGRPDDSDSAGASATGVPASTSAADSPHL